MLGRQQRRSHPRESGRRLPGITADQAPDHGTIARFRVRHQEALADLLGKGAFWHPKGEPSSP